MSRISEDHIELLKCLSKIFGSTTTLDDVEDQLHWMIIDIATEFDRESSISKIISESDTIDTRKRHIRIIKNGVEEQEDYTVLELLKKVFNTYAYESKVETLDDEDVNTTELVNWKELVGNDLYWSLIIGNLMFGRTDGERAVYIVDECRNIDEDDEYNEMDAYLSKLYVHSNWNIGRFNNSKMLSRDDVEELLELGVTIEMEKQT